MKGETVAEERARQDGQEDAGGRGKELFFQGIFYLAVLLCFERSGGLDEDRCFATTGIQTLGFRFLSYFFFHDLYFYTGGCMMLRIIGSETFWTIKGKKKGRGIANNNNNRLKLAHGRMMHPLGRKRRRRRPSFRFTKIISALPPRQQRNHGIKQPYTRE